MKRGGQQLIPRPDTWEPGEPNPWHGRIDPSALTLERAERAVRALNLGTLPADPPPPMRAPLLTTRRAAAVLVPLYEGPDGEARLILTRRSARLSSHRGEVAFPGGRLDEGETVVQAALREAHEEIDLLPELVRVVGTLEPLSTVVSDSAITPVVAVLDGGLPKLTPSPSEVARVFDVSLRELIHADTFRAEVWIRPEVTYPVFFFEVEDDTIWGATGRMVYRLLSILTTQFTMDSGAVG